ncbi:MAG: 1-acyl-sn-glycerol-3-phosphate acyltransferase [Spirochaetaceae bacterium]|nr:1-acyl-sn-glycerol-3-phosphate acyltransferase [Spirochaetaceae bacterium]
MIVMEIPLKLLFQRKYNNRDKLKGVKRAVLVSNHTTFIDPVNISGIILPPRTWHTLLEATVEFPFLGTFIRLLGGVPIPRGRMSIKTLVDSADMLFKHRKFIHFYPEGECYVYNQEIREFKPGAFYLAASLGIPVYPIVTVIHKKTWPFFKSFPRETFVILDPLYPKDYIKHDEDGAINADSVRSFGEAVRNAMQAEIDRRGGIMDYYRGAMPRLKGIND